MIKSTSRRWRWAVPAAGPVLIGVVAGALIGTAPAAPTLAARTPAQLLADVSASGHTEFIGTVTETASLGLPAVPLSIGGNTSSDSLLAGLLSGSHTVRVWFAGPGHFRLAVQGRLSETDLVRDGDTLWQWQSALDTATRYTFARAAAASPSMQPPLTPQQAVAEVIADVGPATVVSTDPDVSVAGQSAYELVLAPKDKQSLIGQVRMAVDAANGVPLRVEVFSRGDQSPAFVVGYTQIQFTAPASGELTFAPPPGSTVRLGVSGSPPANMPRTGQGFARIGSGWTTVLTAPASVLTPTGSAGGLVNSLLGSAARVSGSWGNGQLMRTSLVNVLLTGGTIYAGAVKPSVLFAAAAHG